MEEASSYTVLVVEDDPTHQLLIRRALGGDGGAFSIVHFAESSRDAERFARQMAFDVLLVDNRIPGSRGLDLVTTLRDQGVTAPFVLMTSSGSEDLAVQAYRAQAADYVIKDPGFWKDLPQTLIRVVEADRAKKAREELVLHLERANRRLDELNTEVQLQNEQLRESQAAHSAREGELAHARAALADLSGAIASALGGPLESLRSALATIESAVHVASPPSSATSGSSKKSTATEAATLSPASIESLQSAVAEAVAATASLSELARRLAPASEPSTSKRSRSAKAAPPADLDAVLASLSAPPAAPH